MGKPKNKKTKNTLLVDDMTQHLKDPRSHKKFLDQTDSFSKRRIQNWDTKVSRFSLSQLQTCWERNWENHPISEKDL